MKKLWAQFHRAVLRMRHSICQVIKTVLVHCKYSIKLYHQYSKSLLIWSINTIKNYTQASYLKQSPSLIVHWVSPLPYSKGHGSYNCLTPPSHRLYWIPTKKKKIAETIFSLVNPLLNPHITLQLNHLISLLLFTIKFLKELFTISVSDSSPPVLFHPF